MKKLIALLLAMALLVALCACGKKSNEDDDEPKTNNTKLPIGEQISPSRTQIIYATDANGNVSTQIVYLPDEEDTDVMKTQVHHATAVTSQAPTTTTPTYIPYEDGGQFNDATLAW